LVIKLLPAMPPIQLAGGFIAAPMPVAAVLHVRRKKAGSDIRSSEEASTAA
jgi:hypothetical protein